MNNSLLIRYILTALLPLTACLASWAESPPEPEATTQQPASPPALAPYDNITLPPLADFLATATEHPTVKMSEAQLKAAKADMAILNRDWLGYVSFQANYRYGYNSYWYNSYLIDEITYDSQRQAQHNYSVGVSLNLPLSELFTRRYRRRKQQAMVEQQQYAYELSLENRQVEIMEAYNNVMILLSTIQAKAETAALYNVQMRLLEQDFVNGRIEISELSLERSRTAAALTDFEQSKVELSNAITLLEMMTGIKAIKTQ